MAADRQRVHDPDRLAALEEERDFLLSSLDDLEVELAAGDLDLDDYAQLKDDYTVRAAETIRSIDNHNRELDVAISETERSGRMPTPRRRLMWAGAVVVFGLLAGFGMAKAAGERGINGQITGSIDESVRDQVLRCQQLGTDPSRLLESLTCFDEVLVSDPQNVTALTYRGWYVVLASGTAAQAGQTEDAAELLASGERLLAQAADVDPGFPDARAFRAIVFERQGETDLACAELAVLAAGDPPPMITQLVAPLAERLACQSELATTPQD
ncbi:MAG: hypothetical protein ACI8TP_000100 [Acidimicrobiales bacterium]|jgi:hypothetical protein